MVCVRVFVCHTHGMNAAPGHRDAAKPAAGSELKPSGAIGRRTPGKVVYQPPCKHVCRWPEHASRKAWAVIHRLAACDTQVEAVGIITITVTVVQVHSLYPAVLEPVAHQHGAASTVDWLLDSRQSTGSKTAG